MLLLTDSGIKVGDTISVELKGGKTTGGVAIKCEVHKVNVRSLIVKLPMEDGGFVKRKFRDIILTDDNIKSMKEAEDVRRRSGFSKAKDRGDQESV